MSNFLAHDMTPQDPKKVEKMDQMRRDKEQKERPTRRASSLAHESEEHPKNFDQIVKGEFRDFNFDGTPKQVAAYEGVSSERRAVKSDAKITNGANQYTPEQLEKIRIQNEQRRLELQEFKKKHKEAKDKQDMAIKQENKKVQDEESKSVIGNVPDLKSQNGRKAAKDHVYQRTDKFDIILGQEVDHIYDKVEQKPIVKSHNNSTQYEGGLGDQITDDEFKNMGVKSRSFSTQNSQDFNHNLVELKNSLPLERVSKDPSRAPTAQLPAIKNASTQVTRPPTTTPQTPKPQSAQVQQSQQIQGKRKPSFDYNEEEHQLKVIHIHIA